MYSPKVVEQMRKQEEKKVQQAASQGVDLLIIPDWWDGKRKRFLARALLNGVKMWNLVLRVRFTRTDQTSWWVYLLNPSPKQCRFTSVIGISSTLRALECLLLPTSFLMLTWIRRVGGYLRSMMGYGHFGIRRNRPFTLEQDKRSNCRRKLRNACRRIAFLTVNYGSIR